MNATGNPQPFYADQYDGTTWTETPRTVSLAATAALSAGLARKASACLAQTATRASPPSLTG